MTGTDALLQGVQKLAYIAAKENTKLVTLERVPVLGVVGTAAAAITTANKLNQFINDPKGHWIDGVEGTGAVIVAVFAPEFLVVYFVVETGVDIYRDSHKSEATKK